MGAEWVTVDEFSRQTGIRKDEANKKCRSNEWPQGSAWLYYSENKRLINLTWWNDFWNQKAKAFAKQEKAALKGLSSSQIIRDLEK